jgi:enoyl-CoA hydratase/carnithine racemase
MAPVPTFATQPPPTSFTKISFPVEHVLLITLSRPKSLNCINSAGHKELDAIYNWFDREPALRVAVLTGEGRAFCAGADLKG